MTAETGFFYFFTRSLRSYGNDSLVYKISPYMECDHLDFNCVIT